MSLDGLEQWHFEITQGASDYLLGLVLEGKKRAAKQRVGSLRPTKGHAFSSA